MHPTRPTLFATYTTLMGVAATFVVVTATKGVDLMGLAGPEPTLFWIFSGGLLTAEIRPPAWLRFANSEVSLSWVFAFALLLCGATSGAFVVLAVAAVIGNLASGMSVVRNVFNTSQMLLSLAAGLMVLNAATGGHPAITASSELDGRWLAAVVAAAMALYVTNAGFVAVAVWIAHGHNPLPTFAEGARTNLGGDGLLLALAPIAVQAGMRSIWLLVPLVVTALGTYRVARLAGRHEYEANHDELTGLANRRHFYETLRANLIRSGPGSGVTAVAVIDLDNFKTINDTLGHQVGDLVLTEQARRIREVVPEGATVARLGGDEFAVMFEVSSRNQLVSTADIAARHLAEPILVAGTHLAVSASIGIAIRFHEDEMTPDDLLAAADRCMYESKGSHRRFSLVDWETDDLDVPPVTIAP